MDKTQIAFVLSIATAIIGVATTIIALSQLKIASARNRLDLYNKRFNIYLCALDYYQAVWGKSEKPIEFHQLAFIRCYRESRFLFKQKDGIYETLTAIKDSGAGAAGLEKLINDEKLRSSSDPRVQATFSDKRTKHLDTFEKSLMTLEEQLQKYIRFEQASGWHPFR